MDFYHFSAQPTTITNSNTPWTSPAPPDHIPPDIYHHLPLATIDHTWPLMPAAMKCDFKSKIGSWSQNQIRSWSFGQWWWLWATVIDSIDFYFKCPNLNVFLWMLVVEVETSCQDCVWFGVLDSPFLLVVKADQIVVNGSNGGENRWRRWCWWK